MRLLFVADGRSPTALNWISYFVECGDAVHLVSTFPAKPMEGLASYEVIPVALSQTQGEGKPAGKTSLLRKVTPVGVRTRLRQWLGPLTLPRAAAKLRIAIERVAPDVVHAMRIPLEGMLAGLAFESYPRQKPRPPLLLSIWGNDFTLHASSTRWMADLTTRALRQADGLHTDCLRDQRLARQWGYAQDKPVIVLPGGGGIRMEVFNPGAHAVAERMPVVINPRGFRAYVRNDTFFRAIPEVLSRQPAARFLCPTMEREPQAQKWVAEYEIRRGVDLLPFQTQWQMAELYQRAQVVVSLTTHDGTPNTLLEALACGCFPVVGDLESLREWVRHGDNGLLVDPGDPQQVSAAILAALSSPELRTRAAAANLAIIRERAEYGQVMQKGREFYNSL